MASSIIPLRLSSEVEWEARLKAAYDALPKTRRMEYLRGLLQRGMLALEAEQAGEAGLAPPATPRPVPAPARAVMPAPRVAAPAPEPVVAGAPASSPATAQPAPVPPAQAGATKSALDILGGSSFLSAARSSAQTQPPSSQA